MNNKKIPLEKSHVFPQVDEATISGLRGRRAFIAMLTVLVICLRLRNSEQNNKRWQIVRRQKSKNI